MNIHALQKKKSHKQKITMMTCYDYTFAKILDQTPIDALLVGDSAAMTMHGYKDTIHASLEMITAHTKAVHRGASNKLIIADLPFLSYRKSLTKSVSAAEQLIKAGAHALKLEGAQGNLQLIQHFVSSGVPIMGHLGLTPQFIHTLGGYKVQGREEDAAVALFEDALRLEKSGCFAIVLECVPWQLAQKIALTCAIPIIGIGAGCETDGQILVLQDALGMNPDFKPKFVKHFLDGFSLMTKAITAYVNDVQQQAFPEEMHHY